MSPNQTNYIIALCGFVLVNILLFVFAGRFEGDKSGNSIFITLFNQSFHLHHWLIGLFSLVVCLIFEQYIGRNLLLSVAKGVSIGFIFHGLTFYLDYFKIGI